MRNLIGALALGVSGFVLAQGAQYPSFEEVDTNQDGQLGRSELAAIEGLDFAELDANQDGSVDRQEYMAAAGGETERSPGAGAGAGGAETR